MKHHHEDITLLLSMGFFYSGSIIFLLSLIAGARYVYLGEQYDCNVCLLSFLLSWVLVKIGKWFDFVG